VRLHIEGAITSRSMSTSDPWEIVLAGPARKSLERVHSPDRERIEAALKDMAENPFQGDLKLLKGQQKTFRRRIGAWRIFFFRVPNEKWIVVSAIERRTSTRSYLINTFKRLLGCKLCETE
jgi:mRNA-degrading endonuclease RelE of RelBE toxin-antitoxin system